VPRYDYLCDSCGETFEVRASMAEYSSLEPHCARCDSDEVSRVFAGLNVIGARSSSSSSDGCCQPSGFG